MSKFNPKTVPNWVRWIAVDKNGMGWGFSMEPTKPFMLEMWWPKTHTSGWVKLYEGKPPKNWKEELYTWG